ncbi:hypothetical protein PYCCODRAFT_1439257 [Trametes coccinea BRFM310]|uniref:Uncharacterized protein n=1 Tax=Trametes coccinea (strain BRFM310) TaxID=1353009 RepID=A0A1Y2IB70_TRAC3|nr:hypothetical protein PYCCODRAFT_1439257 [Trametes coccinea BRFM310]
MDFEVAVGPTKRKSIPRARERASEMPRSKRARTVSENPTFLDYDVAALLNNDDAFPPHQPSSTQDATPFARATTSSHPRVHNSTSLAEATRAATPQSTWLVAAGLHCYPPGVHSQAYWPAVQTHENVYPLMPASVVNPPPLSPPTFTVPTQLPSYQVAQWSLSPTLNFGVYSLIRKLIHIPPRPINKPNLSPDVTEGTIQVWSLRRRSTTVLSTRMTVWPRRDGFDSRSRWRDTRCGASRGTHRSLTARP